MGAVAFPYPTLLLFLAFLLCLCTRPSKPDVCSLTAAQLILRVASQPAPVLLRRPARSALQPAARALSLSLPYYFYFLETLLGPLSLLSSSLILPPPLQTSASPPILPPHFGSGVYKPQLFRFSPTTYQPNKQTPIMAAQHQARPSSSASSTRPSSAHPQLRLPLSHHGLPRAPTSPESSYSSRSQRYEPLSKDLPTTTQSTSSSTRTSTSSSSFALPIRSRRSSSLRDNTTTSNNNDDGYESYEEEDDDPLRSPSHFFRLSLAPKNPDTPPSPPMTPFSPSAFPGTDEYRKSTACCPRCRASLPTERPSPPASKKQPLAALETHVQRARSMDELPSPVRRMLSTRSVGGARARAAANPYAEQDVVDVVDPAVQAGILGGKGAVMTPPPSSRGERGSSSSSFAVKFGKKIKEKLGGAAGEQGAEVGAGRRASGRKGVEYEEMEEVHWTEI